MPNTEFPDKDRHYPGAGMTEEIPTFEGTPLTRVEYIQALVHFYRGELNRATQWRLRLDNTTNWAIFSVMGLITFSLGDPSHSHVAILAGMVLVFTFLSIEARRFRFFDVWRARVRMLEENFYGPILRRDLRSPVSGWGNLVAEDLLHPRFKITYHQAFRARLVRNYIPIFSLLLFSWVIKLLMHPWGVADGSQFFEGMSIGPIAWWFAPLPVLLIYLYLLGILVLVPGTVSPEEEYWGSKARPQETLSRIDI
jgi:uncharacterized membrane protein